MRSRRTAIIINIIIILLLIIFACRYCIKVTITSGGQRGRKRMKNKRKDDDVRQKGQEEKVKKETKEN